MIVPPRLLRPAAVLAALAPVLLSSGTTAWEMNSYADFVKETAALWKA